MNNCTLNFSVTEIQVIFIEERISGCCISLTNYHLTLCIAQDIWFLHIKFFSRQVSERRNVKTIQREVWRITNIYNIWQRWHVVLFTKKVMLKKVLLDISHQPFCNYSGWSQTNVARHCCSWIKLWHHLGLVSFVK